MLLTSTWIWSHRRITSSQTNYKGSSKPTKSWKRNWTVAKPLMRLDTRWIRQSDVPNTRLNRDDRPANQAKEVVEVKTDFATGMLAGIDRLQTMPEILQQFIIIMEQQATATILLVWVKLQEMSAADLIHHCDRRVHNKDIDWITTESRQRLCWNVQYTKLRTI